MIKMMFKYKFYLVAVVLLMILEPSINSVLNFWLQSLFNSATVGKDVILILRMLTAGFLLWMFKRVVVYAMLIIRDRFICNMKRDIKQRMFEKLINANTSNISGKTASGEYISMFTNDIALIEQRYLNQLMGLASGFFSVAILGYSFVTLNTKIALAIIGTGVITAVVPALFSKKLNEKNVVYTTRIGSFTQKLKEYITAFPTIKNYSVESGITETFSVENDSTENAKFEADCAFNLANSIGQLVAWFMQFVGVGLGVMLVVKGEIKIGTVVAAQAFAGDLALPIQNIIININSLRSVKNVVKKIESVSEWCEEGVELENITESCDVKKEKFDIDFQGITFKVNDKVIIDDFTYKFESGKKYLIVGVNGAGKSSVFKILKKWYKSCSGTVTINDRPVSEYSNQSLSEIVSYLNEDVSVFSGSLKDNITLFREFEDSKVEEVAEKTGIGVELSRGIKDEGINISSGEKRRIEIARSLLQAASILIFDEVVSTLDIETAYEIEKAALELRDKTVIFISHNFSGKLIREYDEILVMSNGKLISSGSYEQLLECCPYFKRICDIKFG